MLKEDFIIVDAIRTHVVQAGTGKPLLLIHGLGGPQMWQRVIEPIAKSFRVIAIDLPGFGDSDCPPAPYSTEEYAVFLDHLLSILNIPRVMVAGISYGGHIALVFAHQFRQRVEKLVLIASTGLRSPNWFAKDNFCWMLFSLLMKHTILRSRTALEFLSRESFFDLNNRPANLVESFHRQLSQPGKRDAWLSVLRNVFVPQPNLRCLLSLPDCPPDRSGYGWAGAICHSTLLLWGANDRAVPPRVAEDFHRLIPHSMLKIIPECAHSVPLEKPEETCEEIINFVY